MMTLREHLEAIRDGMAALPVEATYRANREARTHAIAALAILDAAELDKWWDNSTEHTYANPLFRRLVPDPEASA